MKKSKGYMAGGKIKMKSKGYAGGGKTDKMPMTEKERWHDAKQDANGI
jgi:hypothetical protein